MNIDKKIKIVGAVIGILLLVILLLGFSYALFTWKSNNVIIGGNAECFNINYTKGQNINNESVILFDESKIVTTEESTITVKKGMALTNIIVSIDSACNINKGNLLINLNVTNLNQNYIDGDSIGAFKYAIVSYEPNVYTDITAEALDGITFNIIERGNITSIGKTTIGNEEITTNNSGYIIIFYVDGNLASNNVQDSVFSATIEAVAESR